MLVPSTNFCDQVRFSLLFFSPLQVLVCILVCCGKGLVGGVGNKGGSSGPAF